MRQKKLADIEALKQLRLISDTVLSKRDDSLPAEVTAKPGADILYRNLETTLGVWASSPAIYQQAVLGMNEMVQQSATVDWWHSHETKRQMRSLLDDYLYDEVKGKMGIDLSYDQIETIITDVMILAENNHDVFIQL